MIILVNSITLLSLAIFEPPYILEKAFIRVKFENTFELKKILIYSDNYCSFLCSVIAIEITKETKNKFLLW